MMGRAHNVPNPTLISEPRDVHHPAEHSSSSFLQWHKENMAQHMYHKMSSDGGEAGDDCINVHLCLKKEAQLELIRSASSVS